MLALYPTGIELPCCTIVVCEGLEPLTVPKKELIPKM